MSAAGMSAREEIAVFDEVGVQASVDSLDEARHFVANPHVWEWQTEVLAVGGLMIRSRTVTDWVDVPAPREGNDDART